MQHLLPRHKFPVTLEALHWKTRAVVWTRIIEAPSDMGGVIGVDIPPLARFLGHPVAIRATHADGTVETAEPPTVN